MITIECDTGTKRILEQWYRELDKLFPPLRDEGPEILFHYTDARGLIGILRERKLWLTHFRHLNDKTELAVGENLAQEVTREILDSYQLGSEQRYFLEPVEEAFRKHLFSHPANGVFVASFSERANDLPQWRTYGSDGHGYSLGFRMKQSPQLAERARKFSLVKCIYEREKVKANFCDITRKSAEAFKEYARTFGRDADFAQKLATAASSWLIDRITQYMVRYKDASFSSEREWRAIATRTEEELCQSLMVRTSTRGIVPYVELAWDDDCNTQLLEVMVGPSNDTTTQTSAIEVLLRRVGDRRCKVLGSTIPYRG